MFCLRADNRKQRAPGTPSLSVGPSTATLLSLHLRGLERLVNTSVVLLLPLFVACTN